MTVFNGVQMTKLNDTPQVTPDPGFVHGTTRQFAETFTMDTQTTSDTINVCRLPKGAVVLYGILTNSATMGAAATVAIGITGTTGKYRAAAVKTTITPEVFGVAAGLNTALTAEETVFITIAVASLAAAGTVTVTMVYGFD